LLKRFLLLTSIAIGLGGCNSLPRSGPNDAAFEKQATARLTTKERKVGIEYAIVDVTKNILASFASPTTSSIKDSFEGGKGGPPDIPLGIGDIIQVSIFEAQAGGLYIPAEVAGSRPGNYITLPSQTIDRGGTLTVPYAGRIVAAGRPKEAVEREIEDKLSNRAIEPQVVITTVNSHSSEVAVLGDVNKSGKFEITAAGDRVLDVISSAGGLSGPSLETYVTLQRRNKSGTISYDKLQKTPTENIFVAPGDTVLVNRERRTYSIFGASGLNGRFDFEDANLTFGEALGKAGGLLDGRADPARVFLYRSVPRNVVQRLGVDTSRFAGADIPVIFRANMRDPSSFFAVQTFAMQDKDIIYISNSDSVELVKFLDVLNSASSTSAGVVTDAADAKSAVKSIAN
jgi:polysaccharide export outer membrane protein